MPVQLPTVDRFEPQAPAPAPRINVDVPDSTRVSMQAGEAGKQALDQTAKMFAEQEDHASDLTATNVANSYAARFKVELAKVQNIQGDPTSAYHKFDEDSSSWANDLTKQYEGSSERTKAKIAERIQMTHGELQARRSVDEALQYQKYEKNTTDAAIQLGQEDMMASSELLNAKDTNTFSNLDNNIYNLKKLHTESGLRTGTVLRNSDGSLSYTPQALIEMKKDVSDGLKNVIETLNASGKTDEAQMLLEKYKDDLTADTTRKLTAGHKDSLTKNQALAEVDKVQFLDPVAQLAKLNKISNVEVKEKALSFANDRQRYLEQAKNRASNDVYEKLSDYIRKRQSSGQNFVSVTDLQNDETYSRLRGSLNSKDEDALEKMIKARSESTDNGRQELLSNVTAGGFKGMSYPELLRLNSQLSKSDQKKAMSYWTDANSDSDSEKSQRRTYMTKKLKDEMQASNVIKKNVFGKYTNDSEIKITNYQDELQQVIDGLPANMDVSQQNKVIKDFIDAKKKNEIFTPPSKPNLFGAPKTQSRQANAPVKAQPPKEATMTDDQINEALQLWKTTKGRSYNPASGDTIPAVVELWQKSKNGGK